MKNIQKPQIFNEVEVSIILNDKNIDLIDSFESQLEELFYIKNPNIKKGMPVAEDKLKSFIASNVLKPIWIYYPWYKKVVKSLPENEFYELRTARNKNIISYGEQKNYRNSTVGIAGLSVGSAVVAALVISGGSKTIKIADFDKIELTNLNRIRAKVIDLGSNKTSVTAREAWDLDPFANIEIWPNGITNDNLEKFISDPKLDIFIDEFEDIGLKIKSRLIARKHKIPVLMATDNGDNIILDVERFDIEENRPIFHGLIDDFKDEDLQSIDYKRWLQLATKIVGPEYLPKNMKDSLMEIGKSLPSVPQLGSTAQVSGSAISFVVRSILNKSDLPSGRYVINFERIFTTNYDSLEMVEKRNQENIYFVNNFGKKNE